MHDFHEMNDNAVHSHEHDHHHTEHGHDHHHEEGGKSLKELYALVQYMHEHNAAHTRELEELAGEALRSGQTEAYYDIMDAVRSFMEGNTSLAKALSNMPSS